MTDNELVFELIGIINSLKEEIERLTIELDDTRGLVNSYKFHYDQLKARSEREERKTNFLDKVIDAIYREATGTVSNTCVVCGKTIPEGRQVCPSCEGTINKNPKEE